ncbi:TPA: Ig-like domain-containing protein, partial [Staphylococcus aureus]
MKNHLKTKVKAGNDMDNKKQIFSIRKCTLGVGSFLIGSFIFFSFAPMQVEAAENTDSSSIQNTNIKNTESSVESNEAPTEKAAEPSVESNEASTEKAAEPSVESNEAPTSKEGEPSVESNEAPTPKEGEPSVESNEAPTPKEGEPSVESNEAPTPKEGEPSVESNEAPTSKEGEPSVESNEAPTPKEGEPSVESNEAPTSKEGEPSVESNEAPTSKEGEPSVESNEAPTSKEGEPSVENNETPVLKEADPSSRKDETVEAKGVSKTALDSEVNDKLTYEDLENLSNEIDKNKNSNVGVTRSKRSVVNEAPKLVKAASEENSEVSGKDVSKIVNPKFKFGEEKWDPSDDETVAENAKNPQKNRYLNMDFTVPKDVKAGDYFKVKLPKEVAPILPDAEQGLTLGKDKVYANAKYDAKENAYTVTFTEEAENYKNYRNNLKSKLKVNRDIAQDNGEYNLQYQVGDKKYDNKVNIEYYITPKRNKDISSALQYVKKENNKYKYEVNYTINSIQKSLKDVKVVIERHANPKNKVPNNVTDLIKEQNIKVYEVLDVDTLNDSGSLEGVKYKDVTNIFKPTISKDREEITFDFKDTNKTYILSVEGENNRPFNEGDRLEGRATVKSPDHEKPWYYDFIYTKTEPTKNDEIGEKINPPEIEKIKDQSPVEVGTPIAEIGIKDKNNDRGPLTHEVTGLPDGVTFDPETNTIKGTPTKSGEYEVTVKTTDPEGNETET